MSPEGLFATTLLGRDTPTTLPSGNNAARQFLCLLHSPDQRRSHVVRRWFEGQMLEEHHVLEDLFAEWHDESVHVSPLRNFLVGLKQKPWPSDSLSVGSP